MDSNYLNRNFYLGGYYILKTKSRAEWMNSNILPEKILSGSRCISDFYPDLNCVWSESKEKKENYIKTLGLDNLTYTKMEQWISEAFGNNFYYPDVFNSYELAKEFYHKFLNIIHDLKIIGMALPVRYRDVFLEEEGELKYGIYKNLKQSLSINLNGRVLGYEVLGYEVAGFHSYICYSIENDYYDKYNIKLNNNGFISTLDEATILADYTNNEVKRADSVLWLPWIIIEYPL